MQTVTLLAAMISVVIVVGRTASAAAADAHQPMRCYVGPLASLLLTAAWIATA